MESVSSFTRSSDSDSYEDASETFRDDSCSDSVLPSCTEKIKPQAVSTSAAEDFKVLLTQDSSDEEECCETSVKSTRATNYECNENRTDTNTEK